MKILDLSGLEMSDLAKAWGEKLNKTEPNGISNGKPTANLVLKPKPIRNA